MIFSDSQLALKGKRYILNIICRSTRRLTTMEWMILKLVKDFSNNSKGYKIKYAFEEVMNIQNSDMLLKPSFEELLKLGVISINKQDFVLYSELLISDIKMTESGLEMLEKGLRPGEMRQLSMDLTYDPTLQLFNKKEPKKQNCLMPKVMYSTYVNFPKNDVISELQNGNFGTEKFIASRYIIDDIEVISEENIDIYSTVRVDVNLEDELITTKPTIHSVDNYSILKQLIYNSILNENDTKKLRKVSKENILKILGTGSRLKENIYKLIKQNFIVFMNSSLYNSLNPNLLINKKIIVFDGESKKKIISSKNNVIHIPDPFINDTCCFFTPNGNHIGFSKMTCFYDDKKIDVPFAYVDKNLTKSIIFEWLSDLVKNNISYDISYGILAKFAHINNEDFVSIIDNIWKNYSFKEIIEDINKLTDICETVDVDLNIIQDLDNTLIEKAKSDDSIEFLKNIGTLTKTNLIQKNSDVYINLINNAFSLLPKPTNYNDLNGMMKLLMITSHDEAVKLNTNINILYNRDVISDVIQSIVLESYRTHDSVLELDCFFNDYVDCLKRIKIYLDNKNVFEEILHDELVDILQNNIDVVGLSTSVQQLRDKHSELTAYEINMFEEMRKYDKEKTEYYIKNLREIENISNSIINGAYDEIKVIDHSKDKKIDVSIIDKDMYFLDTCALINQPDLFLYFKDDEYINVPVKVIDELGKIKDSWNKKSYGSNEKNIARKLSKDIYTISSILNKDKKFRFNFGKIDNEDDIPFDLDKNVPDNNILATILKYKHWKTHLVSDDNQFRLMASAYGIAVHTSDEFIKSHKQYYRKLDLRNNFSNTVKEQNKETNENRIKNTIEAIEDAAIHILPNYSDYKISELRNYGVKLDSLEQSLLTTNKIKYFKDLDGMTKEKIKKLNAPKKLIFARNTLADKFDKLLLVLNSLK